MKRGKRTYIINDHPYILTSLDGTPATVDGGEIGIDDMYEDIDIASYQSWYEFESVRHWRREG